MRWACLAFILGLSGAAAAQPPTYHAGFLQLTVADTEPFPAVVWYPTETAESVTEIGPFPVAATAGAPIVPALRLPIVLFSHGSGGSPWVHRELAAQLARDGFIVVVPVQIGDSAGHTEGRQAGRSLLDRPRQAAAALGAALADPRLAGHADPTRLGLMGFSAGGYTALVLAGARPDFALALAYCAAHAEDRGSCGPPRDAGSAPRLPDWSGWVAPRLAGVKALVLMDPLAILFDAAALRDVGVPVLLYRPQDDAWLAAAGNALAVAAGLPQPPQQVVVPGRHFVFVDPCPAPLAARAPDICADPPGVDRVAIHQRLEMEVSAFLRRTL